MTGGDRGVPTLQITPPARGGLAAPSNLRQNLPSESVRQRHKRIIICADGTWNSTKATDAVGSSATTNVWLTYQIVKPKANDGTPQLAYYHPGVGTGGFIDRVIGGATGYGLNRNIQECYRFLIDHYHPGDYVYFFGFSRGAYTVRSLAGLVRNCGVIDPEKLPLGKTLDQAVDEAFRLYRKRGDATAPSAQMSVDFRMQHSHPDFRITCIGVWDTVGSLGIPVGLLGHLTSRLYVGFHDVTLSSWVDCAFHAVAVDERRRPFVPTLWLQQASAREHGQRIEQRWFTGVHSDVGGGYTWAERGLATLTLRWMIDRVTTACRLELDPSALDSAPPSGSALHDSLNLWYRFWAPANRTIDGGLGHHGARDDMRITDEVVDESVGRWRAKYSTAPMPVVNRPYVPANVLEYEERISEQANTPPVQPPDYPSDLRETGLPRERD
jgi:uncharacterized protein (DUF2235 family)